MLVEEKAGVRLLKNYSGKGGSGYVYWVAGQEDARVFSYTEALEMFQEAVGATLEPKDGDCPRCGGNLRSVGLGQGRMHRYAKRCNRCGYLEDEMDESRRRSILEQAHAIKKDVPSHRTGRVGVKEFLQGNEEGFDPRFD